MNSGYACGWWREGYNCDCVWRWMTGLGVEWMNRRKGDYLEVDDRFECGVDGQE